MELALTYTHLYSYGYVVMEVIRHAELIVECFLSSDLLVCSIVQRNHSTIMAMLYNII